MTPPTRSLYDELICCVVRVVSGDRSGTGFFVAPGQVLTCAHVVLGSQAPCAARVFAPGASAEGLPATLLGHSADDVALLSVPLSDNPCVLLDDRCAPHDPVFLYGYPGQEDGTRGESVTAQCEGPVLDSDAQGTRTFHKFTPGGVRPGMSGAPLLNESTGAVCGIVKRTRSIEYDQGGLAIPLTAVSAAFSGLAEENVAFHRATSTWKRAMKRSGAVLLQRLGAAPAALGDRIPLVQFETLVRDRTAGFVGREFVFTAIDQAMSDRAMPSGYILVIGEPGLGKTALMAWLVKTRGYVHHFNVSTLNIRTARQFVENITSQLIVQYGLSPSQPPADVGLYGEYLDTVLREATAHRPDESIVILVDALDEATDDQLPERANRLFLPSTLPERIYVVATSRPLESYRLQVSTLRTIKIHDEGQDNLRDARAYVQRFVEAFRPEMEPVIRRWMVPEPEFVSALIEQSQGNFMYLKHLLPDLKDGRVNKDTIGDIHALPRGLVEYYGAHWRQAKACDPSRFERVTKPAICMFATAKEPVTVEQVVRWTHARWPELGIGEIRDVVADWREFLDEYPRPGAAPLYRIYHEKFREFLEIVEGLGLFHDLIIDDALRKLPDIERLMPE
jgi:hypothetical protein